MGLQLTTDRYPPITSQARYPLRHTASQTNTISSQLKQNYSTERKVELSGRGHKYTLKSGVQLYTLFNTLYIRGQCKQW